MQGSRVSRHVSWLERFNQTFLFAKNEIEKKEIIKKHYQVLMGHVRALNLARQPNQQRGFGPKWVTRMTPY